MDVVLVDKEDNEIGIMEKLQAHKKAKLHRAFSIFIFNSKKELLILNMETAKHYYELMTDFAGFAIKDFAIKKFTQEALSVTYNETFYKNHKNFFTYPSSSSGKHHPPEDNGEGGIVRHLLKAAFVGPTLLQDHDLNIRKNEVLPRKLENGIITQKEYDVEIKTLNQISEKNDFYNFFTKTDYDMVISANLIHDICKNCKDCTIDPSNINCNNQ